jgi:hypothetical protein
MLPNLPQQAVLVKDYASYHNVKMNKGATSATKKNDMISWLIPTEYHPRPTQNEA